MKNIFILFFSTACSAVYAQNVGIGTNTPDPSAKLEIASTAQGLLIPRMTTIQRNAIANPATGLQVFNLDDNCTDIYDGSNWIKNCGLKVTGSVPDPSHPSVNSWVAKANFNSGREGAVAFSIGSKGYMGTGWDGTASKNDFWEYNPGTNSWTQKANFGGTARQFAAGFSIGDKGYLGTGDDGAYKKDFWEYNAGNNTWTQKADFGGPERVNAVGFSINAKGYMGTGYAWFNDLWEYTPAQNTWTRKADYPGGLISDAVGFSIGDKGYIGTGTNTSFAVTKDFYQYDPTLDRWAKKVDFGGSARQFAAGFSIGTKGYIGTGYNGSANTKDFWQFDPASTANGNDAFGNPKGAWVQKTDFLGTARTKGKAFSIGNKGFILTGWDGTRKNDMFEYMDDNAGGYVYNSITPSQSVNTITIGGWASGSNNSLYNSNSGNVGINNTSPISKLHIINSSTWSSNEFQNHGLAISTGSGGGGQNLLMGADGGNNVSYIQAVLGNCCSNHLVLNPRGGNVGIGVDSPLNALSVAGGVNVDEGNTNNGNLTNALIFGPAGSGEGIASKRTAGGNQFGLDFYTADTVRMSITNAGRVGIGTTNPTAALEINPIGSQSVGAGYVYQPTGPNGFGGAGPYAIAVKSTGSYIGTYYFAVSDQRIKNITGRSNPATDLSTINQLQVTDYTYIDKPAKGSQQMKGFIAQEVEKLIPDAVNTMTDFIPNIYTNAQKVTKQKNGNLLLTLNKPHAMKAGDMVRLYNDRQQDCKVEQVVNSNSFVVSGFNGSTDKVFVYGQQVNDYKSVDYDRIFSTGIGAIQELSKQVDAVKAGIQADDKEFEERVKQLEKQLQEKKEMQPVVTSWK